MQSVISTTKQSFLNVLIDPGEFFEQEVKKPETLIIPALIVLAGAIVSAASGYTVMGPVAQMMAGAMPSLGSIIIIGAGFAGLSVGIYAQMNGYHTQIFEMHSLPGGLCTAWKRKGYTIDGCIHWLMGTNPSSDLNSCAVPSFSMMMCPS